MSDVTLNPLKCALDEAQALRGQVDALQAENAALREEFNKMDVWHSKELAAAIDENAKLRELVADMYAVISDRNAWWDGTRKDTRRFADRMRELGVEVDE